ncbi:MAG TPA: hypothetical protein VMM78_01945 [Thermomicrobiales bacterium]|nr:hypothetical protein [Thermomicrobiales bacterium]
MQAQDTKVEPTFGGTKAQKSLAKSLFAVFNTRGRFYGDTSPISLSLNQIVEYKNATEPRDKDWTKQVSDALNASPEVFVRSEVDGVVEFTTTRRGVPPGVAAGYGPPPQMLERRFETPEPKRAIPPTRRGTRLTSFILPPDDREDDAPFEWQDVTPQEVRDAQSAVLPSTPTFDVDDDFGDEIDVAIDETPSSVVAADVGSATNDELSQAIRLSLSREISIAQWGDLWMNEDKVQRFSRGDLRRIEDLLRDQNLFAVDEEIVTDILGLRPQTPEFDAARFAINYRLSRETREFEYVGTDALGVWTLANQPAIGTTKRKSSEIGQDYRFLLDYRTPEEGIEEGLIEHVLSFYEYNHGVLPLDANLATIMPAPGFADQRAARLTFESPQTTETVTAELRFPTSNRGGFIAGLEDFFSENLVPGAVVTIERTDNPTHFLLEYFRVSGEDRKLLHLDDRKGKYTFRSTTYYCATQDDFVIHEGRFPKLADAKPMDDRMRRRPEQVLAITFERVGENISSKDAPRYSASIGDLLVAANVERPLSIELLRDILTSGTYQEFSADDGNEDVFVYTP